MVEDVSTAATDLSQLMCKDCEMLPLMCGDGSAKPNKVENDMEDSHGAPRKGPSEASLGSPVTPGSGAVPFTRLL